MQSPADLVQRPLTAKVMRETLAISAGFSSMIYPHCSVRSNLWRLGEEGAGLFDTHIPAQCKESCSLMVTFTVPCFHLLSLFRCPGDPCLFHRTHHWEGLWGVTARREPAISLSYLAETSSGVVREVEQDGGGEKGQQGPESMLYTRAHNLLLSC